MNSTSRLRGPDAGCVTSLQARCPSLIHAHFGTDACEAFAPSRAARPSAANHLPRLRHYYSRRLVWKKTGWFGRRFLAARPQLQCKGKLFIAVSEFIKGATHRTRFPGRADHVVHYIGIDTDEFRPAEGPETHNRKPIVLFVARLVEKKGCSYLLQAMAGASDPQCPPLNSSSLAMARSATNWNGKRETSPYAHNSSKPSPTKSSSNGCAVRQHLLRAQRPRRQR